MRKLEGKKFGFWTVLKDCGLRTKNREIVWECRCECGTIRNVRFKILKNDKKPRSCGCIRQIRSKEQFEANYEKTDGCWIWKGVVSKGGYGRIGSVELSHRKQYKYIYGKIPKGIQVCHTCDNRLCVNPAHLFLGTIADNMKDKNTKKRQAKGSKIGNSILTEEKVLEIRKMRLSGKEYQEIANHFSIGWYLVRSICKNRQWKHVELGEECKSYISKAGGYKI